MCVSHKHSHTPKNTHINDYLYAFGLRRQRRQQTVNVTNRVHAHYLYNGRRTRTRCCYVSVRVRVSEHCSQFDGARRSVVGPVPYGHILKIKRAMFVVIVRRCRRLVETAVMFSRACSCETQSECVRLCLCAAFLYGNVHMHIMAQNHRKCSCSFFVFLCITHRFRVSPLYVFWQTQPASRTSE